MASRKQSSSNTQPADRDDAYTAFVEELATESSRAAVILGAARLDYLLYQVLSKHLRAVTTGRDDLLESDAPLGTFSARISACYRMALIDADFARALHLIRRIRNSFAHEVGRGSLEEGPHRDRIRELAAPFLDTRAYKWLRKSHFDTLSEPRAEFFTMLAMCVLRLEGLFDDVRQVDASHARSLLPTVFEQQEKEKESKRAEKAERRRQRRKALAAKTAATPK